VLAAEPSGQDQIERNTLNPIHRSRRLKRYFIFVPFFGLPGVIAG